MPGPITHAIHEPLTRTGSASITTRVTLAARAALQQHARECGETESAILRRLITLSLSATGAQGEDALATVIEALGLPPDAKREEITAALESLLSEGDEPQGDAMTDTAETPAPKAQPLARPAASAASREPQWTPSERAQLAKMTPAQAEKFKAMRLASPTRRKSNK